MPTICSRCRKWIDNYNSCLICGYDARFDTHYSLSKKDEELFKDLLNRGFLGRKLKRDIIISIAHGKQLVGVYFVDDDKVLLECSPKKADRLIKIWNRECNFPEVDKNVE